MALFGKDYDKVKVGGDFTALPGGGYVVYIKKAQMTTNSNNLPMVEVMIDVSEGDFAGYFQALYKDRLMNDPNAKYPYNGILRITAVDENGNTKKNFKSFCTAVEKSNDMQLPRHDEAFLKALAGKYVGVLYQREEYEGSDGKNHWSTKPKWYRDVETIRSGRYTKPEDVPLSETYGTGFSEVSSAVTDMFGVEPTFTGQTDTFSAAEDDIPFK